MRLTRPLLVTSLLVACSSEPAATLSATESGGDTSTGGVTTQDTPTSTVAPTGAGGEVTSDTGGTQGMTDSATTTGTGGPGTSTSVESTGTTASALTDTGPIETTSAGPGTSSTGPAGDTSTGPGDTEDSTTGAAESCACPDLEVPLDDGIFVLSNTAELWKYFPGTNEFQILGALECDLPASTFSMAVDRLGAAWVQYSGGQLRKVPVTDVTECTDPGFVVGQQGLANFGMAFVSNSASDACDRIYGARYNAMAEGNAIGDFFSVDPANLQVAPIGKIDYGIAELTGTGDGRTFLFGGANPAKLIEVDKASGAVISVLPLDGIELGDSWAFAFFAGDLYFFTDSQGGFNSEVTHLDYDDSDNNGAQDLTMVVEDAPISIVGAGVSTCAPTLPQ